MKSILSRVNTLYGVDIYDGHYVSPITYAARGGYENIVHYLSDKRRTKPESKSFKTAFLCAVDYVQRGDMKAAEQLFCSYYFLKEVTPREIVEALEQACSNDRMNEKLFDLIWSHTSKFRDLKHKLLRCITNHEETTRLLSTLLTRSISQCDILEVIEHKEPSSGETALHKVCRRGDAEQAQLLLDHIKDPNVRDDESMTPLYTACSENQLGVVQVLLRDPRVIDGPPTDEEERCERLTSLVFSGETALFCAASKGASSTVVLILSI